MDDFPLNIYPFLVLFFAMRIRLYVYVHVYVYLSDVKVCGFFALLYEHTNANTGTLLSLYCLLLADSFVRKVLKQPRRA